MNEAGAAVKESNVNSNNNERVNALPDHLRQYVVDQNYSKYTPIDHAVWRYVMRQSIYFLKEHAHQIYFHGLTNTGISLERIPRIEEMNEILKKIGWGAVAVDGFIPPAAFMEFQAYCVLVIACDMRQINHIEYTPAPDIVHEAAGHAPIIVDKKYANYLQRFGEIGARAMSSKADYALYQAIRHLSILKERPDSDPEEINAAVAEVASCQDNLGEPSEMARLSRLHWWTVEYGLIGTKEKSKIYGAGLLSSIGESVSCLKSGVTKIDYSLDTANYPFDITNKQPHLFVTPDFDHLYDVLEEFASSTAFINGGLSGLQKAIESENASTAVYSSGLQVTGIFDEIIEQDGAPIYLHTSSPSALALSDKQLSGHGKDYHCDGFGSPVGKFKNCPRSPESLDDSALLEFGLKIGEVAKFEFESSVKVSGRLDKILRENGQIILMTFSDCTVTFGDKVLFEPAWGVYDMAIGEKITSVFGAAADKDAYDQISLVAKERTIKVQYDDNTRLLWPLYSQVATIRRETHDFEALPDIWSQLRQNHPGDWLLSMEIAEIFNNNNLHPELEAEIRASLIKKQSKNSDFEVLIDWGFRLIEYHNN